LNHEALVTEAELKLGRLRGRIVRKIKFAADKYFELPYSRQPAHLVRQGIFSINGVLVTDDAMGHRVLYEAYEYNLLEAYIDIHKTISQKVTAPVSSFAMRTLIDLAYTIVPAFMTDAVKVKLRGRYKAMLLLKDYFALKERRYINYYLRLKGDVEEQLTKRDLEELSKQELNANMMYGSLSGYIEHCIKPDIQRSLAGLPKLSPKQDQVRRLYSYYSELLHAGSNIVIKAELSVTTLHLRRKMFLLDSAMAVLHSIPMHPRVKTHARFVNEVKKLYGEVGEVANVLSELWRNRPVGARTP
jgi:hypothetical protein